MKRLIFVTTLFVVTLLFAAVSHCALAYAAPAEGVQPDESTGTVTGELKSALLRRYPMIVYLVPVDEAAKDKEFEPPEEKPTLDQKNKMFIPHVLPVLEGTTIHYVNNDDVKHNVYFIQPDGESLNLGTGTDDWSRDHTVDEIGVYVHRCNVHDEMSAYIVVFDNPYFVTVENDSKKKSAEFELKDIPPGDYMLHVWCEKYYSKEKHKFNRAFDVTVTAGEETRIEVKP